MIQDTPNYNAGLLRLSGGAADGLIYIEQLQKNETSKCLSKRTPWLLSWNPENRKAAIWRAACKMWKCPYCGEANRRRLVARGIVGAGQFEQEGRSLAFLTVTSHEKLGSSASVAVWPKAWKKLHARIQYESDSFEYLAVPELHKNGRMHMHILAVDAPERRWIKDNARACGFGYQSDHQEAQDLRVAGYLAKYTSKSLQNTNFPKGTRRYRASAGWPKLEPLAQSASVQTVIIDNNKPLIEQIERLLLDGFDLFFEQNFNFWEDLIGVSPGPDQEGSGSLS